MVHLNARAHVLFATQHGVASLDQLMSTGITTSQLKRLRTAGAIERILNTAYRSPSVPFDEMSRCAAVCLAHADTAVAGPTAGRLWGFRRLPADHRIHVLAPPASHPFAPDWVIPYRTAAFHPHDIIERSDGIRVTSRARTAFDLSRWLRPSDLLSVIEQAAHDGNLTDADLHEVAIDWVSPRRPWATVFLRQVGRRLPGGAAESHPEVRVANALANASVFGLVRQFRIDLPDYGAARFDLAVPRLKWAIEVDVHPTHGETEGTRNDQRRDIAARSAGWEVSRISRSLYENSFDQTITDLAAHFRSRTQRSA